MRLDAKQLRDLEVEKATGAAREIVRNDIYFILENVYDTYNIGGLFRLADALAVKKMYLCGEMETPPNSRIAKASIGTYKIVPWVYKTTAKEAIEELRQEQEARTRTLNDQENEKESSRFSFSFLNIYAVEQASNSVPFNTVEYSSPAAFLVGNETYGVLPETMELCDKIVEIPMWGINKSLNVIVSAAIVSYWAMGKDENRNENKEHTKI